MVDFIDSRVYLVPELTRLLKVVVARQRSRLFISVQKKVHEQMTCLGTVQSITDNSSGPIYCRRALSPWLIHVFFFCQMDKCKQFHCLLL